MTATTSTSCAPVGFGGATSGRSGASYARLGAPSIATINRPITPILTLFGRLKVTLTRVVITDLRDDIFYAIVYLNAGGPELQLDARPSDAIALAIRAKVPVLVEERVFDKAGSSAPPRRPSI